MPLIDQNIEDILAVLNPLDVLTLCRFCLSSESDTKLNISYVLSENRLDWENEYFYKQYLGMEVNESTKICSTCESQLNAAYKFKLQCSKANKILQEFIQKNHNYFNINSAEESTNKRKNNFSIIYIEKNSSEKQHIKLEDDKISLKMIPEDCFQNQNDESNTNDGSMIKKQKISLPSKKELKNEDSHFGIKDIQDISQNEKYNHCITSYKAQKIHTNFKDLKSKQKNGCKFCGAKFSSAEILRIHIRTHESCNINQVFEKTYKCKYCDRKFSKKKPLQYHEKTHTGERPHICNVCGKSYIQPNNLVIHKRIHTGEKPFVCKICGKGFTNRGSLSLHMPVHTGVKDFICAICGKTMARSGELTIHMRTHTGEKPYTCHVCSKGFIKKSSLQSHMYSHTGEKKHVCSVCGHRVAHAGKLTVHMRTHSDNKPFTCTICNKKFASSSYLKQHSKVHSGEKFKSIMCTQCECSFTKNESFLEHVTKHSDKKAFICLFCGCGFDQKCSLNIHTRDIHSEMKVKNKFELQLLEDKNLIKPNSEYIFKQETKYISDETKHSISNVKKSQL